jgi:hypothetical protein
MIDPTDSEIWFVNWLVNKPRGEATLNGSIALLKIDRLIPDYVTQWAPHEYGRVHPHRFGLGTCAEISTGVKRTIGCDILRNRRGP